MTTPPQQPHPPHQPPSEPWQSQQQAQPWQSQQQAPWQSQQQGQPWQQQQSQPWQQQQPAQHWQPNPHDQQGSARPSGRPVRPNPLGAILMLLGAAICVVSTVLPWLKGVDWTETSTGIQAHSTIWNAWSWAAAGRASGNALGMLLYLALALGFVGSVMVVVAAIRHFAGRLSLGLAWTGTALGLLGTLGTIGTIVLLQLSEGKEGLDIFKLGCWLFAASFLVVLAGTLISRPSARTQGR